jgi:glutamate synthase (ferredoxin)
MVRTCHRDTCPTGIATQRQDLRAKFAGKPEKVAAYLTFVAQEVRGILASLGLASLDDAVGRTELLRDRHGAIDLSPLLASSCLRPRRFVRALPMQRPPSSLGDRLAADALPLLRTAGEGELAYSISNADRAVGARLGGDAARLFGDSLPPGRVRVRFRGQAGQSFGAFLPAGVELRLEGEANDYVGKGLGGGRIVLRPPADDAGDPVLVGNTALYGATGGELYCRGRAGERFAVRNSGAVAVVEGTGDHACEYMTRGTVVVLGPVGRNVGAGMSGGEAYVYDPEGLLPGRLNTQLIEATTPADEQLASVRRLVERHVELTGSAMGRGLLRRWFRRKRAFVRVAPKEVVVVPPAEGEERVMQEEAEPAGR